jgi:hypothetical protein
MAKRPQFIPDRPDLRLHSLASQYTALKRSVKSLDTPEARELVESFREKAEDGYGGYVAVPRLDHFGSGRIPSACDAWHRSTGWRVRTGIRGIETTHLFRASDFGTDQRTYDAFDELERRQGSMDPQRNERNPVRVFAIRATEEADPTLAEGEFMLDLASHVWILATHPEWRDREEDIVFRCAAERFKPLGDRAILVGYRDSMRAVNFSDKEMTHGIALVARIPG